MKKTIKASLSEKDREGKLGRINSLLKEAYNEISDLTDENYQVFENVTGLTSEEFADAYRDLTEYLYQ